MINRFRLPGDDDLIRKCESLKVTLFRESDGGTHAYFELSGSFSTSEEKDGDDDGAFAPSIPAADMEFVRDLIAKFEKVRD